MINKVFTDGLSFALPLLIMAIGALYSEKSGVTNLAIEGFQGVGAFVGALAATLLAPVMGSGNQAIIYIAMVCAAAGGAVFSCLHGLLCIRFRANQVISGVVINILAVALTAFFTSAANSAINGTASNKFILDVSDRFTVPLLSKIPGIGGLFTDMYPFEIVIIVLVVFLWYLMNRTRFGMRLRACGENPHAVDAAGASVNRIRWAAVLISGALSGIGGICFAYSLIGNFSPSIYQGFGYLAIAAMIFGNWHIGPTTLACLVFGLAKSGGLQLCIAAKLPSNYTDLFLMLPYVLTLLLLIFFSKKNHPPKAAGEPWDKSKR
jgi:simple sugar transport system permease protein